MECALRCIPDEHRYRLLFTLLASCLLHGLVIALPYPVKTGRGDAAIRTKTNSFQPKLTATLTKLTKPAQGHRTELTTPDKELKNSPKEKMQENNISGNLTPMAITAENLNSLPPHRTNFYPTNKLTVKPQPLGSIEINFDENDKPPPSGIVVLVLWIDEKGDVVNIDVEQNSLPDAFVEVAAKAFRNSQFIPGELNETKVGSIMLIEFRYDNGYLLKP